MASIVLFKMYALIIQWENGDEYGLGSKVGRIRD